MGNQPSLVTVQPEEEPSSLEEMAVPGSNQLSDASSSTSSVSSSSDAPMNPYVEDPADAEPTTGCYPMFSNSKNTSSTRQSSSSLHRKTSTLSFSDCMSAQDDDDDDENEAQLDTGTNYINIVSDRASYVSSFSGCMPKSQSCTNLSISRSNNGPKRSGSWSNLQLDSSNFLKTQFEWDSYYTPEEELLSTEPTPESDLRGLVNYWIVTTAALPWMTGTAVNPLLRAAYLSQRNRRLLAESQNDDLKTTTTTVTLALPWLESSEDRVSLYGPDWKDATPDIQEGYIRNWLANAAQLPLEADESNGGIAIQWYPARYHAGLSSIFAMGDLCAELEPTQTAGNDTALTATTPRTVCILEEPEHVNFYRAPGRLSWRDKFPHVIGIIHTNYKAYAQNHYSGIFTGPLIGAISSLMVRAYCDKVVKLSPVLQTYAPEKEVVSNVHGIRQEFLQMPRPSENVDKIYFIGKLLWAKGLDKLLELQGVYKKATGQYFPMDIYGSGPQQEEIECAFLGKKAHQSLQQQQQQQQQRQKEQQEKNGSSTAIATTASRYWRRFRQPIPAHFMGRKDHAAIGSDYKIFVNPSITEVLCTTTAEAVAMGKWVIIPKHASNEFFLVFSNCLQYSSKREFVQVLQHAMQHPPPTDSVLDNEKSILSWEAATDRLIDTASLSQRDAHRCRRLNSIQRDKSIQEWHYTMGNGVRGDVIRKVLGGGPVAEQSQYQLQQQQQQQQVTAAM